MIRSAAGVLGFVPVAAACTTGTALPPMVIAADRVLVEAFAAIV